MTSDNLRFPIVGIGASAGGIPAMEGFFKGMPRDCGMAFVVVTHLSPERESRLHEVVGRYTEMDVIQASDGTPVKPGVVYVMPENTILTIKDAVLLAHRLPPGARERKPVDVFLSELADDQREYAVGIILSGGDSDGTLGTKAIKERGGLTMAQVADGSGPSNPDMPQSAISTGMIDFAIPVEDMGEKLTAFARSFELVTDLTNDQGDHTEAETERARHAICAILKSHTGHDFSGYKTKTFLRRVKRRMQVKQLNLMSAYLDYLRSESEEVMDLFRDLLINVTNFFRDADAFKILETDIVPKLFEGKNATDTVRVWIPGCATGEEVYSIAILLREHMDTLPVVPRVQIFATDIDEPALGVARAGRYPETLLDGVSLERRQKYFLSDGASFVIANAVRELCIFSPHSVIRDPPFSRMDLVSCRNLLIYLGPDIQHKVIPTFHYALKPGGYLFLGTSEGLSQHTDLFTTVDKKNRIFQAREHAGPVHRLPMLNGEERYNVFPQAKLEARKNGFPLRQAVEGQVLERFSPPHVVVNADGDIVYYSARTGKYIEAAQGAPNRQLLSMARRGLRLELRAAFRDAVATRQQVRRENIVLDDDEDRIQLVNLTIEPLAGRASAEALYLVLFENVGSSKLRSDAQREQPNIDGIAELERELRDTRERLQSTIEEYETALEELKSSNEELVSVNEEAQSSNEELEASKEEMQSLNEELNTINAELSSKVEDLDGANSDLRNLFAATQIATVFLDRNLVIRNFTPAASAFFNVRPSDIGRPLTELSSDLNYPELKEHIAEVFSTGGDRDHHLARDEAGRYYLARLIPYRGDHQTIDGVIVTLIDVTSLAEAEEHQKVLISELNHRVKNMLAVTITIATQTLATSSSPEAFNEAFIGRLKSMSRAYGLLTREQWKDAAVRDLLTQELAPFGDDRFALSGPDCKLTPQRGLALSMVTHELATNAAKYGALSTAEGSVSVEWALENGNFVMKWIEREGPVVTKPEVKGFGSALLEGEISYRLGGNVETKYEPHGLTVDLSFPLVS
jgi:two-component system, chemotaxis family, CheB/CheR fusion protein